MDAKGSFYLAVLRSSVVLEGKVFSRKHLHMLCHVMGGDGLKLTPSLPGYNIEI